MHNAARFAILAVLILTGCSWYPYSPYYGGYNSYPSYVPPGGYQAPGPTYVPQNGPVLNQPTSPSLSPSSPSFSPHPHRLTRPPLSRAGDAQQLQQQQSQQQQLNNNNAPLFNTNPPNTPVPLPRDPDHSTASARGGDGPTAGPGLAEPVCGHRIAHSARWFEDR